MSSIEEIRETNTEFHPNGNLIRSNLTKRPKKDQDEFFKEIFPDSYIGRLLKGNLCAFLSKQEHRMGWPKRSACDDQVLYSFPNETVAAHQWGVAFLVASITMEPKFQEEMPNFNREKAFEMALTHDVAELITGDITPDDGITPEEKHEMERVAMNRILACFPSTVEQSLHQVYGAYEDRQCAESKFVKDCDKLDFILYAFLLERQGFSGFSEFYLNTVKCGFSTKIVADLAETLTKIRHDLWEKNLLYGKGC